MRQGGSYEMQDGKPVLKERTTVSEHGARPFDAKGKPLYQRPHEAETIAAPVVKKSKDKGGE